MSFVFLLKPTDCPRLLLRSSWQLESPTDTPPPFPSDYSWLWNRRAMRTCPAGARVAQACPDLPCCRRRRRVPRGSGYTNSHRGDTGLRGPLAHASCTLCALEAPPHLFALGDVPESASLSLPCPAHSPSRLHLSDLTTCSGRWVGVRASFLRIPGLCSSRPGVHLPLWWRSRGQE